MEVLYKVIKTTLEQELDLYNKFLATCFSMREYAKVSEIDDVKKCVKEQENVVDQISDLEASRLLLVEEFAEQNKIDPKEVTMTKIAKQVDEKDREEFVILQSKLKNVVKDIQKENKTNSILIGEILNYIHATFEIITGTQKKSETYNQDGIRPEKIKAKRNIFNKVI